MIYYKSEKFPVGSYHWCHKKVDLNILTKMSIIEWGSVGITVNVCCRWVAVQFLIIVTSWHDSVIVQRKTRQIFLTPNPTHSQRDVTRRLDATCWILQLRLATERITNFSLFRPCLVFFHVRHPSSVWIHDTPWLRAAGQFIGGTLPWRVGHGPRER